MRFTALGALALMLAACSGADTADKDETESEQGGDEADTADDKDTSDGSDAASSSADSDDPFSPGVYRFVVEEDSDGQPVEEFQLTLGDGKTFEVEAEGITRASGTYTTTETADGARGCFTDDGDTVGEPNCFTIGPRQEDGTWTATNEDDEDAKVIRVES